MRRRRADFIRARATFAGPSKGRIYVSNRILQASADSLAPRLDENGVGLSKKTLNGSRSGQPRLPAHERSGYLNSAPFPFTLCRI